MNLLVMGKIALLWSCWCFMHSFLLSNWFISHIRLRLNRRFAWYRICFNIISLVTLVPVIFYQLSFKGIIIFEWSGPWRLMQICLMLYGSYMFYVGRKRYDLPFFLGIRQARSYLAGNPPEPMPFHADYQGGIRHPWYSGSIAMVIASGALTDITLASKSVLICYLVIGTFLEELKLVENIGSPYIEYQKNIPMLFPWRGFRLGRQVTKIL